MSGKSSIEWTDATWNPTRGCTKIAQGCKGCYAETFAERFRGVPGHPYERGFDPRLAPDKLTEPLKWREPRRIFVDSMSDLFHDDFPFEYIAQCFAVMALCPQHTFQVLTKRPERALEFFRWVVKVWPELDPQHASIPPDANVFHHFMPNDGTYPAYDAALRRVEDSFAPQLPLPNVCIGTSIAHQPDADKNIPVLLQISAAVRFVSVEPLIGPVRLDRCAPHTLDGDEENPGVVNAFNGMSWHPRTAMVVPSEAGTAAGISWVIVGGESGHKARPMHPDWARSLRDQCIAAGVPFFFKQWGEWAPLPEPFRYTPAMGSGNREYNLALKAFAREYGPRLLLDDRVEGWDSATVKAGAAINDGGKVIGRVGKKAAGRLLDGRTWNEFPEVANV